MAPRSTPKPVKIESKASPLLHLILVELGAASHNWSLLADRLGQGYSDAYKMHEAVLKKVQQNAQQDLLLKSEVYYFIFQAICVGFAGGILGGAMAPWIKNAQQAAFLDSYGKTFVYLGVEGARGSAQEMAKQTYKNLFQAMQKQSETIDNSPYIPVVSNPADFTLDVKTKVDELFVVAEEPVVAIIDQANAAQWSAEVGNVVLNDFRSKCPLLIDAPSKKEIPYRTDVARSTELAMWVAWASVLLSGQFGSSYYSDYAVLDLGIPKGQWEADEYDWAVIHAKYFKPVLDRMVQLRSANVSKIVGPSMTQDAVEVLDLRKVRDLNLATPDLPFSKLSGLVNQWIITSPASRAKYLAKLKDVRPANKK